MALRDRLAMMMMMSRLVEAFFHAHTLTSLYSSASSFWIDERTQALQMALYYNESIQKQSGIPFQRDFALKLEAPVDLDEALCSYCFALFCIGRFGMKLICSSLFVSGKDIKFVPAARYIGLQQKQN